MAEETKRESVRVVTQEEVIEGLRDAETLRRQRERIDADLRRTEAMMLESAGAAVSSEQAPLTDTEYRYLVMCVSNRGWPLASMLPQFAICHLFKTKEEAEAYRDAHQRFKADGSGRPDGPIFLVGEVGKDIMLAYNPQRMFGNERPNLIRKGKLMRKQFLLVRDAERAQVKKRVEKRGKDEEPAPPPAPHRRDPNFLRMVRSAQRRERIHAFEALQFLEKQSQHVKLQKEGQSELDACLAGEDDGEDDAMDEEWLATLPDDIRDTILEQKAARAAEKESEEEQKGESAAEEREEKEEPGPSLASRMVSVDELIAYMKRKYEKQGIKPASAEQLDAEEKAEEERLARNVPALNKASKFTYPDQDTRLGGTEDGQVWAIVTILMDTVAPKQNRGCREAAYREHMIRVLDCAPSEDMAKRIMKERYAHVIQHTDMHYVRMNKWICFERVTDDDGENMYREETMEEFAKGQRENAELTFIKKAVENHPNLLPKPKDYDKMLS